MYQSIKRWEIVDKKKDNVYHLHHRFMTALMNGNDIIPRNKHKIMTLSNNIHKYTHSSTFPTGEATFPKRIHMMYHKKQHVFDLPLNCGRSLSSVRRAQNSSSVLFNAPSGIVRFTAVSFSVIRHPEEFACAHATHSGSTPSRSKLADVIESRNKLVPPLLPPPLPPLRLTPPILSGDSSYSKELGREGPANNPVKRTQVYTL